MSPYIIPGLKKGSMQTTADHVIEKVLKFYDVAMYDIMRKNREHKIVRIRRMMMWIMRNRLRMGVAEIGRKFGQDHTTVLHALQKFNNERDVYPEITEDLDNVLESIRMQPLKKSA